MSWKRKVENLLRHILGFSQTLEQTRWPDLASFCHLGTFSFSIWQHFWTTNFALFSCGASFDCRKWPKIGQIKLLFGNTVTKANFWFAELFWNVNNIDLVVKWIHCLLLSSKTGMFQFSADAICSKGALRGPNSFDQSTLWENKNPNMRSPCR